MQANALAHEKSPYLLQHAHNPVAWMPWGEPAFARARQEDKPIFLSIGYSTCHWCHVMAHESFESDAIAETLNRHFVSIKLDREERPDIDRIYMLFVQATVGGGGWPLSVWLTPDLKPFFGGTYFPPDSRYGRPGFRDLLTFLAQAWANDRERIETSSTSVKEQLQTLADSKGLPASLDLQLFASPYQSFRRTFDSTWGGFGTAPKFPRPVAFRYLLRYHAQEKNSEALEMVVVTLAHMSAGGMRDHLGGGFHRYSVDERWFVPHFEKMLYDQAQLAIACLDAFVASGDQEMAAAARDVLTYVTRDLTSEEGAFYSAEDADSPDPEDPRHSREGAFYVWTSEEIERALGSDAARLFSLRYGVESDGNVAEDPHGEFRRRNILFEALSTEECAQRTGKTKEEVESVLTRARAQLFKVRERRPRPHLDRKILTSWNSLMVSAFARAYQVLADSAFLSVATRAGNFLLDTMYESEAGQLFRRYCDCEKAVGGFLDDYAFFAQALLDLFEADFDPVWLEAALDVVDKGFGLFEDPGNGGFFSTRLGSPELLMRVKDDYDGAEPAGASVATDVLLRLAHLTGNDEFSRRAQRSLESVSSKLQQQPGSAPQMSCALGRFLAEPKQVVIRAAEFTGEALALLKREQSDFEPDTVKLIVSDDAAKRLAKSAPFLGSLERRGTYTVYRCQNLSCRLPEVIA